MLNEARTIAGPGSENERRTALVDRCLHLMEEVLINAIYQDRTMGPWCIIDDYGAMLSCRAAVDDYRRDHGVREPMVNIDGKGVLWRKEYGHR